MVSIAVRPFLDVIANILLLGKELEGARLDIRAPVARSYAKGAIASAGLLVEPAVCLRSDRATDAG